MNIQKIEFQDEILDTAGQSDNKPRYRIRDNSGNVIYDNVMLELSTPVIQEGTEITANMFGKINNMFENVEKEFMLRKKSGLEIYFGWQEVVKNGNESN